MKAVDLAATAVANTFRSKLRTTLTVLALFVGAFTLTITTALGAGVSTYIETQVNAFAADDVLLVQAQTDPTAAAADEGPAEWDPDSSTSSNSQPGGPPLAGAQSEPLSDDDLDTVAAIEGITGIDPVRAVSTDWVSTATSDRFEFSVNPQSAVTVADLEAGEQLDQSGRDFEVVLPNDYLDALGLASADDAVGTEITIGMTDITGDTHEIVAEVVGVSRSSLFASGAGANNALVTELSTLRTAGIDGADENSTIAIAYLESGLTAEQIEAVTADLDDAGFSAQTIEDQLGIVTTIIAGITGVLNAFAIVALIAAAFGIVNTLLMSVQERTREIGLMKAMGMGSGRIFTLFSLEAVTIGVIGSVIGVGAAMLVGSGLGGVLATGPLADLEGLSLFLFEPASLLGVVVLISAIAFLSGALPASRAARQRPIESLRYE
ncbi:ABC transporter permease [Microcella sp.]|uniref:ABC transporter permease n=1 Tax=Microcella sp. TaxID=1913979 RepID=UPI00391E0058